MHWFWNCYSGQPERMHQVQQCGYQREIAVLSPRPTLVPMATSASFFCFWVVAAEAATRVLAPRLPGRQLCPVPRSAKRSQLCFEGTNQRPINLRIRPVLNNDNPVTAIKHITCVKYVNARLCTHGPTARASPTGDWSKAPMGTSTGRYTSAERAMARSSA